MNNRKKLPGESSKQYYLVMKEHGCDLDQELIMHYVIEGIEDSNQQRDVVWCKTWKENQ